MPDDRFFLSVPNPGWPGIKLSPEGGLDYAYKYGREPGQFGREDTVNIPLTTATLPKTSATLVKEKLPLVWKRLR